MADTIFSNNRSSSRQNNNNVHTYCIETQAIETTNAGTMSGGITHIVTPSGKRQKIHSQYV
jgi:hypothetical protein